LLGNLNDLVPYSREGLVSFLDALGSFAPRGEEVSLPGGVMGELLGRLHLENESLQRALLEEAKAGLSLRELRARVREVLKQEKPEKPWVQEVGERLRRLDLKALPPEKRKEVERHLEALMELLGP